MGQTTYTDVLDRVGPPTEIGAIPSGFYFRYRNSSSIGFRIQARLYFLTKFGFAIGSGDISTLLLYFDHEGVLDRFIRDSYPEDSGWGVVAGVAGSHSVDASS